MVQARPKKKGFIALVAIVAFLLAIGGYFFYHYEINSIQQETYTLLKAVARLKIDQILQWRGEVLKDARLNSTGFIRTAIFLWLKKPEPALKTVILARLLEIRNNKNYENIFLVAPDGRVLLSVDPAFNKIESEILPLLNLTLSTRAPIFGDFFIRQDQKEVHIDTSAPILDPESKPSALLVFRTNPRSYPYPLIRSWPTTSGSAETLLVRKDGDYVLFLTQTRYPQNPEMSLCIPLSSVELPAVQAVLGRTGFFEGTDYRGVKVLTDIRPVPGTPWFMVTKIDRAEIMAEVRLQGWFILTLVLLAILMTAALATVLYKNRQKNLYRSLLQAEQERRAAQETLRESEQRFKMQYQGNPIPTFTWQKKEEDFELIDCNDAAKTITAGNVMEFLGSKASVLYADRQDILQDLQRCFAEKEILKKEILSGHFVPGRLITITMVFVPPDLVMVHLEDITERKQAEEALRESEEKYRRIVELAQEGIWVIDAQANTIYANPRMAEILGYTVEEMLGRSLFSFLDEEGVKSIKVNIERRKKGLSEKFEREYMGKDGKRVQALVSTGPIMDNRGTYLGAIAVLTDITESKRAEEEKRQLEQKVQQTQKLESLGILAGGIAHDFNNLLMVVLGNADLALQGLSSVSPIHPMLTEIEKVALRASELCKQMLAYAGKGAFIVKPIDLSRLVGEMGHMLKISISKKALLRRDLSQNLPCIRADAAQIHQVVMNLIINASEAIGDRGGVISVRTGFMECDTACLKEYHFLEELRKGPYVFLEVADTGCGMDSATLTKIFDPFFTTKFAGRGLGLPAVLGIVRGHKGALKIDSTPGQGTTFRILFPAVEATAEANGPERNKQETWKGKGLLLVVDDEELVRSLCRRMLEHIGFEVVTAGDGREALEVFKKHGSRIRCVLLDLTMPYMDGGETFTELRRLDPEVRVIMCSGYNEQALVDQFFEKGLSGFIQKPYQLNELILKLKSVLME